MSHGRRRLLDVLPFLLLSTAAVAAQPSGDTAYQGLTVAPVQLSLADARRSVSTVVSNPGAAPMTVQVRLYSWTMRGEEEVYAPATDIGFSPPLFRLEAKGSQAVRIVARTPPGAIERSYRLVVDQLPLADVHDQLQLPVRMMIPVFVEPAAGRSRAPSLAWSARYEPRDGRVVVTVANGGASHVRIVNLSADDGKGAVAVAPGLAGYALAGQTRDWTYRPGRAPASLTITADGGATPIHVTVAVTR